MSEQLQLRRGTAAQIAANTPAAGEAWVDTDHSRLVIGDGSTVGGFAAPKMAEVASTMVIAKGVSANAIADTPLIIPLPPGFTRYRVTRVTVLGDTGLPLTAAQAAVYNAASGGGAAVCSPQALSGLTANTPATAGNAIDLTLALAAATFFTATTLFFRITTAQGSAATVDVVLHIQPYAPLAHAMSRTLTDDDFARAAKELGVEFAAIRAVAEVEAAGAGFLPDGRPSVLFEAHVFHKRSKGAHANAKDRRGVALSSPKWNRALYGASGANQHNRIEDAAKLNWDAAHKSASWGTFQVLGENHKAAGHETVKGFVDAMHSGASAHLDAFVSFILANRLDGALRTKNWASFARGYNGPAYALNAYDKKMAAAYVRWKAKG